MCPQGAQRCAPSKAPFPLMRSRPEQPYASRPRRHVSFAVHRPSMRWSRVNTSPPSPPPSTWRMLPCVHGCSAWRRRGPRACWIAHAPGDRPQAHARWNTTSSASSIKTPWSTALAIPHGVVAPWPPWWPTRPGSNSAVNVCAGCEKKGPKLLPPHRATGARPGCSRLRLPRTCRPRVPGSPGREHLAL